jgi:hypothetical protein
VRRGEENEKRDNVGVRWGWDAEKIFERGAVIARERD